MAYGSRIRRERSVRRRRLLWRTSIWLLVAAALGALGYSAYQTGTMLAETRVTELTRRVNDLTTQLDGARGENARLQSGLTEAKNSILALQGKYDSDVPTGEVAGLVAVARQRLGQGLPASRLAQVLRDAAATRDCDTRGTRKRFAIRTGTSRTPEDTASLLDGLVLVTATVPNANADPARSAEVTVTQIWANDPLKLTGLPARQDIILNNVVLHLTVEPSEVSGYAAATLSTCGKG